MALLLFTSPLAILAVQQLSLTDRVGEAVKIQAEVITYLSLAWVVWSALLKFTESYIDVSSVQGESLNPHLLRVIGRTLGVISIIVIFFTHKRCQLIGLWKPSVRVPHAFAASTTACSLREDIYFHVMKIIRNSGTDCAFPSQAACCSRDSGIDTERQQAAESKVRQWAAAQQMPFPTFTYEKRKKSRNTLEYPPEGSPGAES